MDFLFDGPQRSKRTIALAHGAGSGMDTPFMTAFAEGLAGRGIRVARFEFSYMRRSRETGKKTAPDRPEKLREAWLEAVSELRAGMRRGDQLLLAGKSMGGRIASMIAEEVEADGLVCLGYPFHPTGKPDKLRIDHLRSFDVPTLIIQGERDAFGSLEEVPTYELDPRLEFLWMPDGDHSFKPRKSSARTESENWQLAISEMKKFVRGL